MDRRYEKRINRYWASIVKELDQVFESIDTDSWFDYWHTHPDWRGKGNSKPENKVRVIELTYQYLIVAESLMKHRNASAQCFAIIHEDTADNAIYIHTENPNGTDFPFDFERVEWLDKYEVLSDIVDFNTHKIGKGSSTDDPAIFICKKS